LAFEQGSQPAFFSMGNSVLQQRQFGHFRRIDRYHSHNPIILEMDPPKGTLAMNRGIHQALENNGAPRQRNEQAQGFQNSNGEPMNADLDEPELWPCLECARSGLPQTICKSWDVCFSCHKTGNVARHCKAELRVSKKKILTEPNSETCFPIFQLNHGASCSKRSNNQPGNNPLPSLQPPLDSSPTPQANLQLSINMLKPHSSSQPPQLRLPLSSGMAYQRADPGPFASNGFQAMEVQHREIMALAVVCHQPATHEEFTIVSIHPLLTNVLDLAAVCEVVQEVMEEHMNARVRDIQATHLGQALVQFFHTHDRDYMVSNSTHPYRGVYFHFVRHN
jgi:hypothetical protein